MEIFGLYCVRKVGFGSNIQHGITQGFSTEKMYVSITGMSCASCVALIERKMQRHYGIHDILVGLLSGQAEVEYYPDQLTPVQVVELVKGTLVPMERRMVPLNVDMFGFLLIVMFHINPCPSLSDVNVFSSFCLCSRHTRGEGLLLMHACVCGGRSNGLWRVAVVA